MTGYGKAETILKEGKITVEIRSLNGKNADISIKTTLLPKDKELTVRQLIAQRLYRGNIDFFITFEPNAAESAKEINRELAMAYYKQLYELNGMIVAEYPGSGNTENLLGTILRLPDVVSSGKTKDVINDENWEQVYNCIGDAIDRICEYRTVEGKSLYADITARVDNILNTVPKIEAFESERITAVKERIATRLAEIKAEPDSGRLEQEMIYYIEKLDINEEKVRLRQHCKYFMETIDNDPYPGKKLGFIAQEMGREINTTGSKANHSEIQKLVVIMKDELEKIKEQSLNIL